MVKESISSILDKMFEERNMESEKVREQYMIVRDALTNIVNDNILSSKMKNLLGGN